MPHDISLIATITIGLVLAFFGGLAAHRMRLPPLVGYLLAGVALGPFTPGFVGDANVASQLAEIGVIHLMFVSVRPRLRPGELAEAASRVCLSVLTDVSKDTKTHGLRGHRGGGAAATLAGGGPAQDSR